jgi:hypothetical protein
MPEFSGKNGTTDPAAMSHWFCAQMDVLTYLSRDGGNRTLVFNQSPYITKDRLNIFHDSIPLTVDDQQKATITTITRKIADSFGSPPPAKHAPAKKVPAKKVAPGRRGPAKTAAR